MRINAVVPMRWSSEGALLRLMSGFLMLLMFPLSSGAVWTISPGTIFLAGDHRRRAMETFGETGSGRVYNLEGTQVPESKVAYLASVCLLFPQGKDRKPRELQVSPDTTSVFQSSHRFVDFGEG